MTPQAMTDAELDRHIADACEQFERAYGHFTRTGSPTDRDAAFALQQVFMDGCRARRARAGDATFRAAA